MLEIDFCLLFSASKEGNVFGEKSTLMELKASSLFLMDYRWWMETMIIWKSFDAAGIQFFFRPLSFVTYGLCVFFDTFSHSEHTHTKTQQFQCFNILDKQY